MGNQPKIRQKRLRRHTLDYEGILYSKENGIATITLNRPQVLNAVTRRLASEVRSALEDAANDIDRSLPISLLSELAASGRFRVM